MGYPALDPIAGVVVAAMIIKVGIELYLKSVRELVDESADDETIEEIRKKTMSVKGVKAINDLKTRVSGNTIYVDIDIAVKSTITVEEGHDISDQVHELLERDIDDIKHCMVHVEPYKNKENKNYNLKWVQ